jgi:hypothetical protein
VHKTATTTSLSSGANATGKGALVLVRCYMYMLSVEAPPSDKQKAANGCAPKPVSLHVLLYLHTASHSARDNENEKSGN